MKHNVFMSIEIKYYVMFSYVKLIIENINLLFFLVAHDINILIFVVIDRGGVELVRLVWKQDMVRVVTLWSNFHLHTSLSVFKYYNLGYVYCECNSAKINVFDKHLICGSDEQYTT